MGKRTVDLTWRTDGGGAPILSQRAELVLNKIEMLLNLIPGKDPRDLDRGLNVRSRLNKTYNEATRDTAFENEITRQITKYTDITVSQVMVIYKDAIMYIYMAVTWQNESFIVDIKVDENTLSSQLRSPTANTII